VRCISGHLLVEFPLSTVRLAGMVLPAAGGGYFRLFPYWWTRLALQTFQRQRDPATCYFHPYELDTSEMAEIPYRVPTLLRWSQGANRRSVRSKLRKLLSGFRFRTMAGACQELPVEQLEVGLDLNRQPATYDPEPRGGISC
jgi:hypothetical protein